MEIEFVPLCKDLIGIYCFNIDLLFIAMNQKNVNEDDDKNLMKKEMEKLNKIFENKLELNDTEYSKVYFALAKTCSIQEINDPAEKYFFKSLKYAEKKEIRPRIIEIHLALGKFYMQLNEYSKGEKEFLKVRSSIGDSLEAYKKESLTACLGLYDIYFIKTKEEDPKYNKHREKFNKMRDIILGIDQNALKDRDN